MTTLKEVAVRAGVSVATVSRVIGGNYPVASETKQRVMEAIEALGYHPNGIARSLRRAKSYTLGVLIPDLANLYFMQMVRAIENVVDDLGYHLLVASSNENSEKEKDLMQVFLEKRLDGVVVAPVSVQVSEVFLPFINGSMPMVFADRVIEGMAVDSVREEGRRASQKLIQYVLSQGHRNIAVINRHGGISTAAERDQGYRDALASVGLSVQEEYVLRGEYDQETGYVAGKRLLQMGNHAPSAVFCTNNLTTLGFLQAAHELDRRVPEDVSVVSFGDPFWGEFIAPKITSVVQNPSQVGWHVARLLLKRLEGAEPYDGAEDIVLPTTIRLGDSVKRIGPEQGGQG